MSVGYKVRRGFKLGERDYSAGDVFQPGRDGVQDRRVRQMVDSGHLVRFDTDAAPAPAKVADQQWSLKDWGAGWYTVQVAGVDMSEKMRGKDQAEKWAQQNC